MEELYTDKELKVLGKVFISLPTLQSLTLTLRTGSIRESILLGVLFEGVNKMIHLRCLDILTDIVNTEVIKSISKVIRNCTEIQDLTLTILDKPRNELDFSSLKEALMETKHLKALKLAIQ